MVEGKEEIKLTGKQEAFCQEYIKDFNATRSYKDAGYSSRDDVIAASNAWKLLRNKKVSARLDELLEQRRNTHKADDFFMYQRLLFEYLADRTKILEKITFDVETGRPNYSALSDQERSLIIGDKFSSGRWMIEFISKEKARTELAKHLGFFDADNKMDLTSKGEQITGIRMVFDDE